MASTYTFSVADVPTVCLLFIYIIFFSCALQFWALLIENDKKFGFVLCMLNTFSNFTIPFREVVVDMCTIDQIFFV